MANESSFRVTPEDVRAYDVQAVISSAPERTCFSYHQVLSAKSREYQQSGDARGSNVFALMAVVASFYPNYDRKGDPYGPFWRDHDKRAYMAEDLASDDLEALAAALADIRDPEFRARIADVLWERRKDINAAKLAIDAFVQSAEILEESDMWSPFVERLERALQLAAKIGFGNDLHKNLLQAVEDKIGHHQEAPAAGLLCLALMELLSSNRAGNPTYYAELSERLARRNLDVCEWDFAERYYELSARWHRRAGAHEASRNALIAVGETHASKAEANLKGEKRNYMFAAHWMGRAVETLRQAKASPDRIKELHIRFLELEQLSLTEMSELEIPADRLAALQRSQDELLDNARKHVSGLSLEDAIVRLAFMVQPTDPDKLRKNVEEQMQQSPLFALSPMSTVSASGKVTATSAPLLSGANDQKEAQMQQAMFRQASMICWPHLASCLEEARAAITNQHAIRARDLDFLVLGNPFIPIGREGIFARGLQAGFEGDWLVATHLLFPQIENSIRHVLQLSGEIVSTLQADGTQEERDLGWLLTCSKMTEVFGAPLTFDLRGLLIEKFGNNFRNNTAHGLLPHSSFYSAPSVCIWWLTLRLCCRPLAQFAVTGASSP